MYNVEDLYFCQIVVNSVQVYEFGYISMGVCDDTVQIFMSCHVSFTDSAGSSNGCSNNIGVCQQLCLPVPGGLFSCACATGFQLNPDNRTCSPYSSFVIVSMLSAIKGFSLETSDHSEAMVPLAGRGMWIL